MRTHRLPHRFAQITVAVLLAAASLGSALPEKVPYTVRQLFSHSAAEAVKSNRSVPSAPLTGLTNTAQRWLERVISPAWLPSVPHPVCITNEFEGCDVVRETWVHSQYALEVAQTASIFTLRVSQRLGAGPPSPKLELPSIRALVSDILVETGVRWSRQFEAIPIPGLNRKIVRLSFGEGTTEQAPGGVLWGRPMNMIEAGVPFEAGRMYAVERETRDDAIWERSPVPWECWITMVYWWSDGTSIGIYFLKQDGMGHFLNYEHDLNYPWFKGVPLHGPLKGPR